MHRRRRVRGDDSELDALERLALEEMQVADAWRCKVASEHARGKDAPRIASSHQAAFMPKIHAPAQTVQTEPPRKPRPSTGRQQLLVRPCARDEATVPPAHSRETLATVARKGDLANVLRLLKQGCDPNEPDARGETPLFKAVESCNGDVVAALLVHLADPGKQSRAGALPEDLANPSIGALVHVFQQDSGREALGILGDTMKWALWRGPILDDIPSLSAGR